MQARLVLSFLNIESSVQAHLIAWIGEIAARWQMILFGFCVSDVVAVGRSLCFGLIVKIGIGIGFTGTAGEQQTNDDEN